MNFTRSIAFTQKFVIPFVVLAYSRRGWSQYRSLVLISDWLAAACLWGGCFICSFLSAFPLSRTTTLYDNLNGLLIMDILSLASRYTRIVIDAPALFPCYRKDRRNKQSINTKPHILRSVPPSRLLAHISSPAPPPLIPSRPCCRQVNLSHQPLDRGSCCFSLLLT